MNIPELYARYRSFDLVVDSRRVSEPARTLFFALPGARTDGHAFIPALLAAGVRHFVVRADYVPQGARTQVPGAVGEQGVSAVYHPADEVLRVLQALAAHHRRRFRIPVLAITGSNGKTIVKDWLVQLLGDHFAVCASPRSYNSQIGVPLAVWGLRAHHRLAVFEAGVSRRGEMRRLAEIIRPTCGLFTVLGSAHDAGFPDRATKHREKISLFTGCAWVAVSADDTASVGELRRLGVEPLTYLGVEGRVLEVNDHPLRLPFPALPPVYLQNAYAAAAVAYELGLPERKLAANLPRLRPLRNRLEQREGRRGGVVINDSYSNDRSALAAALEFAVGQNPYGDLTLVLGTLQPAAYAAAGELTRDQLPYAAHITRLITVGAANRRLGGDHHFPTPEALLDALDELDFARTTTLVKGASYERLDRVADALSRKQHQTTLELDLNALRHNFRVFREAAGARTIAMVKAAAYGSGALPVARALVAAGADYLAVAYADEGRTLREGGVTTPVLVLNAGPEAYARCATDGLEPVVHRAADLARARAAGLRVHLEVDTGMARLGFPADRLEGLLAELGAADYGATVATVFTHLAAADEADHDAFTRQQLAAFDAAYGRIAATLGCRPARHALNSSGSARFGDRIYEYVRLGIGLYGTGAAPAGEALRPALTLRTYVTRVYERPAGSSVGYGRRGRLTRDSRIAVLPLGYADGLPRLAGEGAFGVRVAGGVAPTVGAVCMDMTMVDVTDLPAVAAGHEAVVFGPDHPIDRLAAAARTIPYEILTGIGGRVHRVYLGD